MQQGAVEPLLGVEPHCDDDRLGVLGRAGALAAGRVVGHRHERVGAGREAGHVDLGLPRVELVHPALGGAKPSTTVVAARRGPPTARSPRTSCRRRSAVKVPLTVAPSSGVVTFTNAEHVELLRRPLSPSAVSTPNSVVGLAVVADEHRQPLLLDALQRVDELLHGQPGLAPSVMPGGRVVQASSGTLTTTILSPSNSTLVEGPAGVERAVVAGRARRRRSSARRPPRAGCRPRPCGTRGTAAGPAGCRRRSRPARSPVSAGLGAGRRRARARRWARRSGLARLEVSVGVPGVVGRRLRRRRSRPAPAAGRARSSEGGETLRESWRPSSGRGALASDLLDDDRPRVGERPGPSAAGRVGGHRDERVGARARGRRRRPRSPTGRGWSVHALGGGEALAHDVRRSRRGSPTARCPRTSWPRPWR